MANEHIEAMKAALRRSEDEGRANDVSAALLALARSVRERGLGATPRVSSDWFAETLETLAKEGRPDDH